VALPGALAFVASAFGQLARHKGNPIETAFNASCRALAALGAAGIYHAVRDTPHTGPDVAGFGSIGALVVTAMTAYAVTTLIIALAAGLQLGGNPLRIVVVTVGDDAAPEIAMILMALPIAYLTILQPIFVPILALPLALVYLSIRSTVRLRKDTHQALTDLVEIIELRDPYTAGHSHRVAHLARALALQVGMTHEEADLVEGAGRVHDLGKVAIDPLVLTKPGRLTDQEYDEMKRHPGLGADVIARFASYQDGVPLIRHHHERWDGAGYPDGLRGEQIPLGARILAVADTYDALTSTRAYRDAKHHTFALQILAEGAGTQWDPAVVDALVAHVGRAEVPSERVAPSVLRAVSV
jgi:HD-GYP domain-containing protein (c-di-GMP phosphodiesterase class II)